MIGLAQKGNINVADCIGALQSVYRIRTGGVRWMKESIIDTRGGMERNPYRENQRHRRDRGIVGKDPFVCERASVWRDRNRLVSL